MVPSRGEIKDLSATVGQMVELSIAKGTQTNSDMRVFALQS